MLIFFKKYQYNQRKWSKILDLQDYSTVGTPPSLVNKKTHQHPQQALTSLIEKKKN
jgi:hypothetical protein